VGGHESPVIEALRGVIVRSVRERGMLDRVKLLTSRRNVIWKYYVSMANLGASSVERVPCGLIR